MPLCREGQKSFLELITAGKGKNIIRTTPFLGAVHHRYLSEGHTVEVTTLRFDERDVHSYVISGIVRKDDLEV